ncbi:MAG: lysophospholipid acyltransferase family protein [Nanoarchaeota archaeon]
MAYPISKFIVPPIFKLWLRKVNGLENIPRDEPFIMAANHTSYYETLLLPCIVVQVLNKKMHAWVNESYWNNPATKFFLDLWECIPVYLGREKNLKEKNSAAFQSALRYLRNGEIMMIFPEGRRSSDGKLQKAYSGAAKLALLSKVPVLPIGVIGSSKVLPKGKIFPRFARCEVKIGKPMYFKKYYNKKINDQMLEGATRDVMEQIGKLIGQKYNY